MSASRTSRFRTAAIAGVPIAAILLAVLAPAAQSDVTATRGNAYGVSVALGGTSLLAPQPVANGTGPPFDYVDTNSLVGIGLPSTACPLDPLPLVNTAQVCVVDATVTGESNVDPHLNRVTSEVTVADVIVGGGLLLPPLLTLDAVTVTCTADGENVTASVNIAGGTLGGVPLLTVGPIPKDTGIEIPGILTVLLNEEVERTEIPGTNRIIINGARINLLGIAEVIIGHVECEATGPDVNQVPTTTSTSTTTSTTSTTLPGATTTTSTSTTSTTQPGATTTTSTTQPGATTTTSTTQPGATTTTSTTKPAAATTTTSTTSTTVAVTVPPSGTTLPVATTTTTTRPPTVAPLARTGSNLVPLVGLGLLAIALGTLVRRSEQSFSPVTYADPAPTEPPLPPEFRPIASLPSAIRRRGRRNPLDPAVTDALTAFDGQDEPEGEQQE